MVGSDSMVDSSVGSKSKAGYESESMVGPRFALSIRYVLGTQDDSDSVSSATGESF